MTDLQNPSPPPGQARPATGQGSDAEAGIPGPADPRIRARARQDRAGPVNSAGATPVRPAVPEPDNWLIAGVAGVGLAAAGVTCLGWYDLVLMCGWPKQIAWVMPLVVDVYGFTAVRVWLRLRWVSDETRRYAAGSAVLAIAVSLAAQGASQWLAARGKAAHTSHPHHAVSNATVPIWIVLAIAMLAPLMLALVAHLFARVNADRAELITAAAEYDAAAAPGAAHAGPGEGPGDELAHGPGDGVAHGPERGDGPDPRDVDHGPDPDVVHGPGVGRDVVHGPDPAGGPDPEPGSEGDPDGDAGSDAPWTLPPGEPDEAGEPGDEYAAARNAYRQSHRDGKPLTDRALGAQFGYSRNWGKTRIREVRKGIHLAHAAGE